MREQLLHEWFQVVKARVGSAEATQKFAQIFQYYYETNVSWGLEFFVVEILECKEEDHVNFLYM
jgi:hypothetical protein